MIKSRTAEDRQNWVTLHYGTSARSGRKRVSSDDVVSVLTAVTAVWSRHYFSDCKQWRMPRTTKHDVITTFLVLDGWVVNKFQRAVTVLGRRVSLVDRWGNWQGSRAIA